MYYVCTVMCTVFHRQENSQALTVRLFVYSLLSVLRREVCVSVCLCICMFVYICVVTKTSPTMNEAFMAV